jgi:hypothetical protein
MRKVLAVKMYRRTSLVSMGLLLVGCVTYPSGPSVMALPGSRMSFDQFRADDADCRMFASQSVGGQDAQQAAQQSGVASAALGTAVGAIAGAAIGGDSRGAAVGAGTGLLFGTVAGTGAGDTSSWMLQRRYDHGYIQCMYAKGHKVPVSGHFESAPPREATPRFAPPPRPGTSSPPATGTYAPPPAPGTQAPPRAPGTYAPPPAPGTYTPPPAPGVYAPPPPTAAPPVTSSTR